MNPSRTAFPSILVFAICTTAFGQAPASASPETQQHIQHIAANLLPAVVLKGDSGSPSSATHTLAERMAALHIPGVSIAVLHHGVIEWAQGFGVTRIGGPPVTADTLFQAGSISKPVAALAALRLVQQGKLSLDTDVNTYLTSWKLPADKVTGGKPVTLRHLLTHTGGTTVHGFPGYAAGTPVPTLVQVLNGEKPANTPAIRSEAAPGAVWNYSGGGFTIMQQAVLDVSKEPFPKLLSDTVLHPIGMSHSTYQQPLPANLIPSAAVPYDGKGNPVAGGAHTYPEMAAAGLWTTPSDLARYAIEIQTSLEGKSNHVLSPEMTRQMLTPGLGHWGLGVETGGSPSNPYFSHGGVNEGFESLFVAYNHGGEGAFITTNAQGGSALAEEIMRSIAVEYNWPDYRPVERTVVSVDPKTLAAYIGTFQVRPDFSVVFTLENGQLIGEPTGQPKIVFHPESETRFFLIEINAEVEFFKDDQGKVTHLVLYQNGHEVKAVKQ